LGPFAPGMKKIYLSKYPEVLRCYVLLLVVCLAAIQLSAQSCLRVMDGATNEPLPFAPLLMDSRVAGTTDTTGTLCVEIQSGTYSVQCELVGYESFKGDVALKDGKTAILYLRPSENLLNLMVVSGTKYIKPIEKLTVSMEVIKAADLTRKITPNLSDAIERLPGINILDGQASIRGGSSYAYGAGSRVLLVVDDMPLMTSDRNDIKWNFVPLELVDQIEVTKGAASVSYGSSALNGVIQVRTLYPEGRTRTKASTFHMVYAQPAGAANAWWGKKTPYQSSVSASHAFTTSSGMDIVLGVNALEMRGFLEGESERRGRISFKTRKFFNNGKASAGIDGNVLYKKQGLFLFWANDTTGAYLPLSENSSPSTNDLWTSIDPWVKWSDRFNNRHSAKVRYYMTSQPLNDRMEPIAHNITADYQLKRELPFDIALSSGLSATQSIFIDGSIGGKHLGNLAGAFVQVQRSWSKLELQAGWRYEYFRIDTIVTPAKPVQSYGLNYALNSKWNLRASYGEGFRFPSGIERFLKYNIDLLHVYPNPELLPERGWNYEVGVKRKFVKDQWRAYADLALFYTRYKNMTEFTFGQWGTYQDPVLGIGFKSVNVTNARVTGAEFTFNADGTFGKWKMFVASGYTYVCPIDADSHPELSKFADAVRYSIETFAKQQSFAGSPLLKYRYRHMGKCNVDVEHESGFTVGAGLRTYSYMERVDTVFSVFIPGLDHYRQNNRKGSAVVDLRLGILARKRHRLVVHCTNVFNRFVALRPAKPEAPRGIGVSYEYVF
jgi:outer membrane receptor protein involved in Fe transport